MEHILPATIRVAFTWLHPERTAGLTLPAYESELAAGMDVGAAIDQPMVLQPGDIGLVPCGFAVAIPPGYEIQVRPRSGLAVKHGITVVNAPGTIDADYRGEVKVGLINLGQHPYTVRRGDRIAQLILAPVARAEWRLVTALDQTTRGCGGFGHTGVQGTDRSHSGQDDR
jgi:deoxyuridine 5''-triphosphate nucleotidohydrolase (dut)